MLGTLDRPVRLADLPPLLRDEPALTRALGEPDARLAVVEVARPIAIAALASLSQPAPARRRHARRPRWPPSSATTSRSSCPAGQVAVFPAWETLPFERVSPSVETMGRRLELLWRLRDPERCPAVIVTGVRGLLQRLGPERDVDRADRRPPGRRRRPRRARRPARRLRLPPRGARRAPRRVRPARGDHRRLPVDRRRARCASTCGATRSTG